MLKQWFISYPNSNNKICYTFLMKSLLLFLFISALLSAHTVTHYTAQAPRCYADKAILRTFDLDDKRVQLVIDTRTLQTSIQSMVKTPGHPCGDSHYTRLLEQSASAPHPLTNDGITHQHGDGIALTTDLCPSSKKGFEKELYEALIAGFRNPVPVTLFITGKWIRKHPKSFRQFQTWQHDQKLAITWGNHTYAHPYHPGKPFEANFALSAGYDLRRDTLRLEQLMIEAGLTPSIFFRFPGLVSDPKAIQTVHDLGLITIGTDAWIAKGQPPHEGSIVLLHGNKNESKGVKMFLEMIKTKQIKSITPML